ncbi:DUF2695 domain-containing protein [Zhihengliuella sp.]|uniref:DUF2695 domain-containing protein n=1 Tax=Zhihengliuella sp. TaxID=1954483 RepID=UPI0028128142|nr:DUF2695 domain-containing protein [Zhihengliuella sp.]
MFDDDSSTPTDQLPAYAPRLDPLDLSEPRFQPHDRECLVCYLQRMAHYGCARHQFTRHYQRVSAPRATSLLERLRSWGGCCCECEIFWNVYVPNPAFVEMGEDEHMAWSPSCLSVRRGSSRPCELWIRRGTGQ